MKVSAKGDYACRALLDIVIHDRDDKPVRINDIADRQDISVKFLEHILASLKEAGILRSIRGVCGGYHLGRKASSISVMDVLSAVDESLLEIRCSGGKCTTEERCVFQRVWNDANAEITRFLGTVTFDSLADDHRIKTEI